LRFFKFFKLYRYAADRIKSGEVWARDKPLDSHPVSVVGRHKLNPVYPQLESAWFQPLSL
jgi:hypothetical protein